LETPSFKSAERNLLDEATLNHNVAALKNQLTKFLTFGEGETDAKMVNNFDWFKEFSFLDFIRDVGKLITVNYMMAKDSVKKRLEGENGLSFTEFSYQLIQGYDFYYLWKNHNCKVQMGGSDQWGNIVTGSEIVRRFRARKCLWINNTVDQEIRRAEIWKNRIRSSMVRCQENFSL
jgi:tyrosyl-tRNA synthetase